MLPSSPVLVTAETDPSRLRALAGLLVEDPAAATVPPSATSGPKGATAVVVDRAALSPGMEDWLAEVRLW